MKGVLHFIKCLLKGTEGVVGIFVNVLLKSGQFTFMNGCCHLRQKLRKSHREKVVLDRIE